ncbi:hypothetical protein OBK25_12965 [Empedobacter falsenii]
MKKTLQFVIITILSILSLNSCSSDDNSTQNDNFNDSYIKASINGREVIFKNVSVSKRTYTNYIVYDFVAKNEANPNEYIEISFDDEKQIGNDAVYGDLTYRINGKTYTDMRDAMFYNVTVNSNNKIEGTFYGTSEGNIQYEFVEFKNGTFKFVNYNK